MLSEEMPNTTANCPVKLPVHTTPRTTELVPLLHRAGLILKAISHPAVSGTVIVTYRHRLFKTRIIRPATERCIERPKKIPPIPALPPRSPDPQLPPPRRLQADIFRMNPQPKHVRQLRSLHAHLLQIPIARPGYLPVVEDPHQAFVHIREIQYLRDHPEKTAVPHCRQRKRGHDGAARDLPLAQELEVVLWVVSEPVLVSQVSCLARRVRGAFRDVDNRDVHPGDAVDVGYLDGEQDSAQELVGCRDPGTRTAADGVGVAVGVGVRLEGYGIGGDGVGVLKH